MSRVSWERLEKLLDEINPDTRSEAEREKKLNAYREKIWQHNPVLLEYLLVQGDQFRGIENVAKMFGPPGSTVDGNALAETLYQWGIGILVLLGMDGNRSLGITHEMIVPIYNRHTQGGPEKSYQELKKFLQRLGTEEPAVHGVMKSYYKLDEGWHGVQLAQSHREYIISRLAVLVEVVLETWKNQTEPP